MKHPIMVIKADLGDACPGSGQLLLEFLAALSQLQHLSSTRQPVLRALPSHHCQLILQQLGLACCLHFLVVSIH